MGCGAGAALIVAVQIPSWTLEGRDAQSMAIPLICYAFGLPGLKLEEILTRPFYAMRQSRLPVVLSV